MRRTEAVSVHVRHTHTGCGGVCRPWYRWRICTDNPAGGFVRNAEGPGDSQTSTDKTRRHCAAIEGLESAVENVDCIDAGEMPTEMIMAFAVVALSCGILDVAVHPLDLIIGSSVLCHGRAVFDVVLYTGTHECMGAEEFPVGDCLFGQWYHRATGAGA